MSWRLAKSLVTLRDQINAAYPARDKSSDGTIGDERHATTSSDHNPNGAGVVCAMDITHDPAHGVDARKLAEKFVASRDARIKYLISNAQIVSSKVQPWVWRSYSGVNAHRHHMHISVMGDQAHYDDTHPWSAIGVSHLAPPSTAVASPTAPIAPIPAAPHPDLAKALDYIFEDEGGYAERAGEPGGAVNMGVSFETFATWRDLHDKPRPTFADLRAIPRSEASDIYRAQYADPIRFAELQAGVGYVMLDAAVTLGVTGAIKMLQRVLGVDADGHFGIQTMGAIRLKPDQQALITALCDDWLHTKKGSLGWRHYGGGWTNRNTRVRQRAGEMVVSFGPLGRKD